MGQLWITQSLPQSITRLTLKMARPVNSCGPRKGKSVHHIVLILIRSPKLYLIIISSSIICYNKYNHKHVKISSHHEDG